MQIRRTEAPVWIPFSARTLLTKVGGLGLVVHHLGEMHHGPRLTAAVAHHLRLVPYPPSSLRFDPIPGSCTPTSATRWRTPSRSSRIRSDCPGQLQVVGDKDHGCPFFLPRSANRSSCKLLARGCIQVPGRLVGEEDQGAVGQGPCHGHPLLLSPGELGREMVQSVGQTHRIQAAPGPGPGLPPPRLPRSGMGMPHSPGP